MQADLRTGLRRSMGRSDIRRSVHAAAVRVQGLTFTAFAGQRLSPFTGLPLLLFARLVFTLGVLALFAFTALMFSPFLLLTGRPRLMITLLFQLRGVFTRLAFAALVNTLPLGFDVPFTPDPIERLGDRWR
ncbi:hypothetical protein ACFQ08_26965 [Streptosporangium algeriense]|uniref:Uncharacterized protein n=1 Tax=Streptosporangium algeriense TaxID=1682748 RepID=A0ABW3DYH0_9ACTN